MYIQPNTHKTTIHYHKEKNICIYNAFVLLFLCKSLDTLAQRFFDAHNTIILDQKSTFSRLTFGSQCWTLLQVVRFHTCVNSLCLPPLQQWASLYQPLIFSSEVGSSDPSGDPHLNKLDATKAFRGKAKAPVPKKKQPAQGSTGAAAAAATKSSAGKQTATKR